MQKKFISGYISDLGCREDGHRIYGEQVFNTEEEAIKHLKRKASKESDGNTWFLFESTAYAQSPVPEIEVVKFS